ncbi:hypothetical protein [Nakamurella sp. PAMC28650]|uniref:hypothetical protein n=1 Tax=Nakamurella sp. PAMC28650 TaxID=2762325 RepID=UPI00164CE26E|nr:hypothetical protein [Nakamurella sp. PAMC28650]QNK81928.1 hypothetical protein H7F38_03815 [Nakamurella sp. PAMC28650]
MSIGAGRLSRITCHRLIVTPGTDRRTGPMPVCVYVIWPGVPGWMTTLGVRSDDANISSATVDTAQQVCGSVEIAMLNTIAAMSAAAFLVGRTTMPAVILSADVHGSVTASWWSAALSTSVAAATGLLLRHGVPAGLTKEAEHSGTGGNFVPDPS